MSVENESARIVVGVDGSAGGRAALKWASDDATLRGSPLHLVHLRNMVSVTEMGAIVCPPLPAFYLQPQSVDDIVDHSVARALDLLGVPHTLAPCWEGLAPSEVD